jgi:protein TonB
MKPQRLFFSRCGIFGAAILLSLATGCATSPTASQAGVPPTELIGKIYEARSLDQSPRAQRERPPAYPFEMRRDGIQGDVTVEFVVDAGGNVRNAHAISATNDAFADAAVQCVSSWKFSPGIKDGQPVNTVMQIPISFSLGARQ